MGKKKLNSMRLLEQHEIPYKVFEFDASIHGADGVAEAVGVPVDTVYKTLVVMPEGSQKPLLVLLAGDRNLNLKQVARATGHKKARMANHDEAEKLTGLKVGGISALALTAKRWPVYIDQPATELEHILISAGQRGINLRVPVEELIRLLDIKIIAASDSPA